MREKRHLSEEGQPARAIPELPDLDTVESHFAGLLQSVQFIAVLLDTKGRVVYANDFLLKLTGWTLEAILGGDWFDRFLPAEQCAVKEMFLRSIRTGEVVPCFENPIRTLHGSLRTIRWNNAIMHNAEGAIIGTVSFGEDITERQEMEIALEKTTRALRATSECSQALIRIHDEEKLLDQICQILVETGGYRMVWIGLVEHDEAKRVRPVAYAGFENGYLDTIEITWADTAHGRGPAGSAIRSRQPIRSQNISSDPAFGPNRDAAGERGYASSIALPLIGEAGVIGVLMIYEAKADAFGEEDVRLLQNLANTLADGMEGLRTRAISQERERCYYDLYDNSPDLFVSVDAATNQIIQCNKATERVTGYTHAELIGRPIFEMYDANCMPRVKKLFAQFMEEGELHNEELQLQCKDGRILDVNLSSSAVYDSAGRLVASHSVWRDITERKQAEEALRQSESSIRNKLNALLEPCGDIETLELADIIDTDLLQSLMEDFYQLTGMLGAVLDISGKVLVAIGWQDICTQFHRCHPESLKNCLESDTVLTEGVEEGTFFAYHCKNNMWDMVTPLMVDGRHVGNVFIGQFFYEDEQPDIEVFREQARRYGFDEADYLAALERTPRFSRESVEAGMRFYAKLASIISKMSFSAIQQSRLLGERMQSEEKVRQLLAEANESRNRLISVVEDQKRTEEERKKFVMLANSSAEFIGMFDLDLTPFYVNPAGMYMVGLPNMEAARRIKVHDYFFPEDQSFIRDDFFPRVLRDGHGEIEIRLRHFKTGQPIWTSYYLFRLLDSNGEGVGWGTVSRNITDHKKAEEKILQLNAQLEQRVLDRTAELQAANKELEAFSYSVSHDLRAPLRAVDGFVRILLEDHGTSLDEDGRRVCGVISKNARNMGHLIDDLLTFSRIGRAEMKSQGVDMEELVCGIFTEITTPENRKRIDFQVRSLAQAKGDPALIRQVLRNLIGNAVKFSSKKERAEIEVSAEVRDNEVIYSVRDNGAGFDMRYIDKLFGVFQRLHSGSEYEGTGVGLAIAQRIVQRHGGRIWGDGKIDHGATFYFTLEKENDHAKC